MDKSRKWLKSNILILITVALWSKVTQSADALAHLISSREDKGDREGIPHTYPIA